MDWFPEPFQPCRLCSGEGEHMGIEANPASQPAPLTDEETMPTLVCAAAGPEQRAADHELRQVIEDAVDALPEVYGSVFMLREVEGLSTAETAACLDINEETVKTRLDRARALLRNHITA